MPHPPNTPNRIRALTPLTLATGVLVTLIACTPFSGTPSEDFLIEEGRDRFATAVAADHAFDIYWLGPSFEAEGMRWEGPRVSGLGNEVPGGGLETNYYNLDSTCCGSLKIVMYTDEAWAWAQERRGSTNRFDAKQVTLGAYSGELRTRRGGVQPISSQQLVLHIGDTVVEAVTGAVVPPNSAAPQPNPLIDEATFLAVMEQLRPYPE